MPQAPTRQLSFELPAGVEPLAVMVFLRIVVFLLGGGAVLGVLFSAVKTFALPRGVPDLLVRAVVRPCSPFPRGARCD